jgi:hypothetical protein
MADIVSFSVHKGMCLCYWALSESCLLYEDGVVSYRRCMTRSLPRGTAVLAPLEVPVDEIGDRFLELIYELEDVANSVPVERALAEFDETTLQLFWKRWPHISGWNGRLWAKLSAELAEPSASAADAEFHETGGSG